MEDISKTIGRQNAENFWESQLKYFNEVEHLCFPGLKIPVPKDENGESRALVTTDENDLKEVYRVPKECFKLENGCFVLNYEYTKKDGTEVRLMQVVNGEIDYKKGRDTYYNQRKNTASDCHVRGAVAILRTERKTDEERFRPTRIEYSYYNPELYDYAHKEKFQNEVLIELNEGQEIESADFEELIKKSITRRWVENKQFPMSEIRQMQIFDEFSVLERAGGKVHKETRDELMQKYIAEIERLTAENRALKSENGILSLQNEQYKNELVAAREKSEQDITREKGKISEIRSEVYNKIAEMQDILESSNNELENSNTEIERLNKIISSIKRYVSTVPVFGKQIIAKIESIERNTLDKKKNTNKASSPKEVPQTEEFPEDETK